MAIMHIAHISADLQDTIPYVQASLGVGKGKHFIKLRFIAFEKEPNRYVVLYNAPDA